MRPYFPLAAAAAGLWLAACTAVPTGPNVMVLPGTGKNLAEFQADDALCRSWAARQTGAAPAEGATASTATGAAVGTALGAASGAAVGAASGSASTGAAVGSGLGLLGGTVIGAGRGESAQWTLQDRYDVAYMQCMYTKGNQIPIPRGSVPAERTGTRSSEPAEIPPPPAGEPPPPPPGPSR